MKKQIPGNFRKFIPYFIILLLLFLFSVFLISLYKENMNSKETTKDEFPNFPEITFNNRDRVLIIAPHPDDEVLANSSVIIKSKKAGAKIKIMFVTFGEHNTSSLAKFTLFPSPVTSDLLAERRHKEAINAAKILGLNEDDLVFLGFPDFGTLKIWDDHFSNKPYFAGMSLHEKSFYPGTYKKGTLYTAPEELELFEDIISSYKPTKIFYPSTLDLNPDHRASGLFAEAALLDLKAKNSIETYTYFVHSEDWPNPLGYNPNANMTPPSYFNFFKGEWFSISLSKSEEILKRKADRAHFSQYWTKPKFMASFIRKNEIFLKSYQYTPNSDLPLWTKEEMQKLMITPFVESIYVSSSVDSYTFNIALFKGVPSFSKIILFVYPKTQEKDFLEAPKYRVIIERGVRKEIKVVLFDRDKKINSKKDSISGTQNELSLQIDLSKEHLPNCEGFFCSVYIEEAEHRVSESPWWYINL